VGLPFLHYLLLFNCFLFYLKKYLAYYATQDIELVLYSCITSKAQYSQLLVSIIPKIENQQPSNRPRTLF